MILVEGADNVGKSTLIKQLLELDPSLRLLHRDRFNKNNSETIATSYLKALESPDGDRLAHARSVADRFLASECIYGALFRGGCRMSMGEHLALHNMLVSYRAIVVHCDPPNESITATWTKRSQMYDDPIIIAEAYRKDLKDIFPRAQLIRYDWTSKHAEQDRISIIRRHQAILKTHERSLVWWSAMPHGAGELVSPSIVLVGEGLSPRAVTGIPFAHGPAGDFLAWTIKAAQSKLKTQFDLYITNAIKDTERDIAMLREELHFLDLPPQAVVVALGREAAEAMRYLNLNNVRVVEIPHPMFWRRFHYAQRHEYVKRFVKAVQSTLSPSML